MPQRFRPSMPIIAVRLGQRAPGGEVVEGAALAGTEGGVGQLATRRPRHPVHELECCAFGRPGAVAVNGVELVGVLLHVGAQPLHPATLGQIDEFRNGLHPKVERVDEASRCRQVGRWFDWLRAPSGPGSVAACRGLTST